MNLANLQGKLSLSGKLTNLLPVGLIITISLTAISINAQTYPSPSMTIGDTPPSLRFQKWIKGTPVNSFKKGNIYVIELWATWCIPCKAIMPHLSELARKYRHAVSFIGIDIRETKPIRPERIKAFVDSMGQKLDYTIAVDDSDYVLNNLAHTTGDGIVPNTFIIDREGRIAWIGHPCYIEPALQSIINGSWDIKKPMEQRKLEFRLRSLQDSVYEVLEFGPDGKYRNDSWNRDSALLLVNEVAKKDPLIKYTPSVAMRLFSILLKNDLKKACEFGKEVLANPTYESAASMVYGAIENLPRAFNITPEIYQLGIDALQIHINETLTCLPELKKLYKQYYRMAEWYWAIGNKQKAIEAQEKAVEDLRSKSYREDEFPIDPAIYEAWLNEYKKNTPLKAF